MEEKNRQLRLFDNNGQATPKHDDMLITFSRDSPELNALCKHMLNKFHGITPSKIYIKSWEPEFPLLNNKFYIGSIDLVVNYIAREDEGPTIERWMLFEFKPKMISFSETLRQIKVYDRYFYDGDHDRRYRNFVVVTFDDISKFKSIFEGQGITLIQI